MTSTEFRHTAGHSLKGNSPVSPALLLVMGRSHEWLSLGGSTVTSTEFRHTAGHSLKGNSPVSTGEVNGEAVLEARRCVRLYGTWFPRFPEFDLTWCLEKVTWCPRIWQLDARQLMRSTQLVESFLRCSILWAEVIGNLEQELKLKVLQSQTKSKRRGGVVGPTNFS